MPLVAAAQAPSTGAKTAATREEHTKGGEYRDVLAAGLRVEDAVRLQGHPVPQRVPQVPRPAAGTSRAVELAHSTGAAVVAEHAEETGSEEQAHFSETAAGHDCAVPDFKLMDRNGDCVISEGELKVYFQGHLGMGKDHAGLVVDGVLLGADADGNGQLTCEEIAVVFDGGLQLEI